MLRANDVDLEILPALNEADLEKLGLSLGQRKKLMKATAGLPRGALGWVRGRGAPMLCAAAKEAGIFRPRGQTHVKSAGGSFSLLGNLSLGFEDVLIGLGSEVLALLAEMDMAASLRRRCVRDHIVEMPPQKPLSRCHDSADAVYSPMRPARAAYTCGPRIDGKVAAPDGSLAWSGQR